MGSMRALIQHVSALVAAKLGRCPKCMGLSLNGAVIGWAVFAGVVHFWPQFPFMNLLVLWPASFTALWVLHLVTFGGRVVVGERQVMSPADHGMTRRRMVAVFGSGVAVAVLASAAAPLRAFGVKCGHVCCNTNGTVPCCPNQHCNPIGNSSPNGCSFDSSGGKTNGICF
jgi:hypothetical protein